VAGTDAIENTTYLWNLQGRHPDRGPGGAFYVDARVPDYADKPGATANFAATFVLARRCVHNLLCQIGDLIEHDEVDKVVDLLFQKLAGAPPLGSLGLAKV
jgi:hypothetical protein